MSYAIDVAKGVFEKDGEVTVTEVNDTRTSAQYLDLQFENFTYGISKGAQEELLSRGVVVSGFHVKGSHINGDARVWVNELTFDKGGPSFERYES